MALAFADFLWGKTRVRIDCFAGGATSSRPRSLHVGLIPRKSGSGATPT